MGVSSWEGCNSSKQQSALGTMWRFRPSALSSVDYATMTADRLYELYMNDNRRASEDGVRVPPPPTSGVLRTCQWNVHHFAPTEHDPDPARLAADVADRLLQTDADVIVLNEYGIEPGDARSCDDRDSCRERLERHGYTLHVAPGFFPTAVATRMPLAGPVRKFELDWHRSAVAVPLDTASKDAAGRECAQSPLWIYGTHLEAGDDRNGAYRLEEIRRLVGEMRNFHPDLDDAEAATRPRLMIIGDFNQQRERDYTAEEWRQIRANKRRRRSPLDDGVAAMLEGAGFRCAFDSVPRSGRNWHCDAPLPSTHWSGTVVDYAYFRGQGLILDGVYVSPCGLSDHRMVVCDWVIS